MYQKMSKFSQKIVINLKTKNYLILKSSYLIHLTVFTNHVWYQNPLKTHDYHYTKAIKTMIKNIDQKDFFFNLAHYINDQVLTSGLFCATKFLLYKLHHILFINLLMIESFFIY